MLYDKTVALMHRFIHGRTLTRWRTRFKILAEKNLGRIVGFLLKIHPEIDIRRNFSLSGFEYLLKLIRQFETTKDIHILIILLELQNSDSL